MAGFRHPSRLVATIIVVVIAAALMASGSASAVESSRSVASSAESGAKHRSVAKKRAAQRRARIRRQLARQLKRNPAAMLKRAFVRRAILVDFKLPLTLRLGRPLAGGGFEPSDDELEITWDDSVIPWPLAGGTTPAVQTSFLGGSFTIESSFSDSDGYGEMGAMETIIGGGVDMSATPFTISDFVAPCPTEPQLAVDPAGSIGITSAGPKYGLMNMFSGITRGSLSLRMTFRSQVVPNCGDAPVLSGPVDNSVAIPMPLRFDGDFRVSPSITIDGKMRVGVLEVDDAVKPQISTFAYVRACSGAVTCDPLQFPARLKLKKMTAEVLLGDQMP